MIALSTGLTSPPPPNTPLRGTYGPQTVADDSTIIAFTGVRLVGDTFSVPVATGCGTTGGGLVDSAIDHRLGLPSPAGYNTMVLIAHGEQTGSLRLLQSGWAGE